MARRANLLGALELLQADTGIAVPKRKNSRDVPYYDKPNTNSWREKVMRQYGYARVTIMLPPEAHASLLYLKKQWGFKSNSEAATAALLYLVQQTRAGLSKMEL